ncbi:MAG: hypothetical protein L6Q55_04335 [Azonexus sp.]|nr:hypothetical protein [Azonexus sp.]MCK6411636.1 hypothetical protein [Azonexus sp.]
MSTQESCELCGLDVGTRPFLLNTPEREVRFCCEGCRGIYEMLHDINSVQDPIKAGESAGKNGKE